jgi:Uma2 family endonuclease
MNYSRENYFTASDLNIYYDVHHPLWHKRPDWFLALDVPRLYDGKDLRRSYVTWQEGQNPYVIVEFLSPGTEVEDLGRFYGQSDRVPSEEASIAQPRGSTEEPSASKPPGKFEVYERYLRVPHYIVYSRYTQRSRYFKLDGGRYREQHLNPENPLIWLADLEIGLGIWSGEFEGVPGDWLRWCDREANWLLTDTEQARSQLIRAAQNLLATGMEMSQVIELLGLTEEQVKAIQDANP